MLPPEALRLHPLLLPASGGSKCSLAFGCITPTSALVFTWSVSGVFPFRTDTCHWTEGTIQDDLLLSLLITYAKKSLFLKNITSTFQLDIALQGDII